MLFFASGCIQAASCSHVPTAIQQGNTRRVECFLFPLSIDGTCPPISPHIVPAQNIKDLVRGSHGPKDSIKLGDEIAAKVEANEARQRMVYTICVLLTCGVCLKLMLVSQLMFESHSKLFWRAADPTYNSKAR